MIGVLVRRHIQRQKKKKQPYNDTEKIITLKLRIDISEKPNFLAL